MCESAGSPYDHLSTLGAAKASIGVTGTPVGRLALEEYPDQALASEELAAVDLASARVDMSELLPRNAFDPSYATATAAHAQRSAASMGSFLSLRPAGQAGGDYSYSYYSYDEDGANGYSGGEYGDPYGGYQNAADDDNYSYDYYDDDEGNKRAGSAPVAVAGATAAAAVAATGEDLYEYYDDEEDPATGAKAAAGVGVAAVAAGRAAGAAASSSRGPSSSALPALAASTSSGTALAVAAAGKKGQSSHYGEAVAAGGALTAAQAAAAAREDDEYEYYDDDEPQQKASTIAYTGVYGDAAAPPGPWSSWADARAQRKAAQRSDYLQRHLASGAVGPSTAAEQESDEAFARQCVLSLQEGTGATLLPQAGGPVDVQLSLSPDGMRLTWTQPGTDPSFVKTTDIRAVAYAGANLAAPPFADEAMRPTHTRFAVTTANEAFNFSIADPQKLQRFICGLRHLARLPIERGAFLWQHAAALNRDLISSASFDARLKGVTDFLQSQSI